MLGSLPRQTACGGYRAVMVRSHAAVSIARGAKQAVNHLSVSPRPSCSYGAPRRIAPRWRTRVRQGEAALVASASPYRVPLDIWGHGVGYFNWQPAVLRGGATFTPEAL